ncbi:AlpA family phage regulatory protein [Dyadobacter sp. CY261]|uniref:helix-turn-helix transcriptional regulator n=1 Tax=Dyadobacter sp. CY261 TaxID=2907203 RepID=UPI001F48B919|nr:AlpA family phage regulatory protein [Dyadobacter sp. CY261]MCF0075206.1 AlpA family phage regulatory protein [Dyadobacter sp. CY261]
MDDSYTRLPYLIGFLRLEQILKLIPVSESTWWRGCKSGRFPKPYKLSQRITAWKISDIVECQKIFLASPE